MVQRKVPNKLGNGIQADHPTPEKCLGKPSSCQHQDGKNKGTDFKKMKKSRSIKLSDIGGQRSSSPLRKTVAQPGKPPPLNIPAAAATPQRKSVVKAVDGSANYMKSTSSSEAKKESSQASSWNTQTDSDSKNLRRRSSTGSKISFGSSNKPARFLTRTSSLKLVRTLTKSPTFKPARTSAKKCSGVALRTDIIVERATCSSTLKDSKFPSYLMLNHGAESEGTSIIKVCPYTYCSLNSNHRTPLPPLKCLLKARRSSMKTQRSKMMEALSRCRLKPSGDGTEGFEEEHVVFTNKTTSIAVDLSVSPMSTLMQGGTMDFFTEIYAESKGNDAEATKGMDDSGCANETALEHDTDMLVSESLSGGSPDSEIDFDENLEHCGDSKVDDLAKTLHKQLKHKDVDEESRRILVKEELSPRNFTDGDKQEGVSSVYVDHNTSDVIDMEWEEWQLSPSKPGYEVDSSMDSNNESNLNTGHSSESHRNNLHDEFMVSPDESVSNIAKEIRADEAEQVFEEDTALIDTCSQVSEIICFKQVSSIEEMREVFMAMEEDEEDEGENVETDFIGIVTISSRKKLYEEPTSVQQKMLEKGVPGTVNDVSEADSLLEIPGNSCTIDLKDEAFESTERFQFHSFDKLDQDETNEDYNVIWKAGDFEADQTITIIDFSPETKLPSGKTGDEKEARKVTDAKLLIGVHDSSHVKIPTSVDSEEQKTARMHKTSLAEGSKEVGKMEFKGKATTGLNVAESFPAASAETRHKPRSKFSFTRSNAKEELSDNHNDRKWTIGRKRHEENHDEPRIFNPREPNFLPIVPEPVAEKVDLRHQMMDERKITEEWMLDHALQQAVTKLAPARKRKVALLVEAFETVLPITKCDTHLRHTSIGFAHGRPVQACN